MYRAQQTLMASWHIEGGRLSRDWSPVAPMFCTNDAVALSEFNAEMSTWLSSYGASSRMN